MPEAPIQHFTSPSFILDCGVTLPTLSVAYQTYGERFTKDGGKRDVVLVSTCFGEVLEGEGNPLIGTGKALDPAEYFIIRVGLIGGSDSSSPSNTPSPYEGKNFPHVTYSDNVRGHVLLLQSLKVDLETDGLWAVVGFSMGGGIAYHWGAIHSEHVKHIVCLATSARTSQHNIAFLEGPKAALIASDSYEAGTKGPKAFGHAYCAWAYSHDWFEQRCWEESGAKSMMEFMDKNWSNDESNGYDLLCLTWTWQNADITIATLHPGQTALYASFKDALKGIKCKALIMPTRTDQYFVPEDSEKEVAGLPKGVLKVVETIYGHVGGGGGGSKEDDKFIDQNVREFLGQKTSREGGEVERPEEQEKLLNVVLGIQSL